MIRESRREDAWTDVEPVGDSALAHARQAGRALAAGTPPGPLHGVPITVKDCIDAAGLVTTGATMGYARRVAQDDAVAVARLKAAGAILPGSANLPETAMACETDNPLLGC